MSVCVSERVRERERERERERRERERKREYPYLADCSWLLGSGPSIWSLLFPLPRPLVYMERDLTLPFPMVSFSGQVDALIGGIPVTRPGIVPLRT